MEASERLAVILDGIRIESHRGVVHIETGIREESIENVFQIGIQWTGVIATSRLKKAADCL